MIVTWRRQTSDWLARRGYDQWNDDGLSRAEFTDRVHTSVQAGETWLAIVGCIPAGTIAVDERTDDGLWTPSELRESVIVHRMIANPTHPNPRGVGVALLDVADEVARVRRKRWVRLDAWTSNHDLHRYYERQGFTHVRTAGGRPSGALFQRKARHVRRDTPVTRAVAESARPTR